MHLTDDRLFDLGDSLLKAIEAADGFAIEVNPDDFSPFLADFVKREIKNYSYVKDILSEKDYKRYGNQLSKKFNKPAANITTQDIFREKNKWLAESYQKGKSPEMLDAYLFDLARRQGKWTGGVEDITDQEGLLGLVDESDIKQIASGNEGATQASMDKLINAYINGNISEINRMINLNDSGYADALIIKRNKKMSSRIDSLARIRSMVFAIGAAHLPGKDGLISLLQKKGFTVEPVFYSKKIKPAEYKFKEVELPWVAVNDSSGYYKAMMPGKPSNVQLYGIMNMKIYFDVFTGTAYMLTSVNTPYNQQGVDSAVSAFANNYFKAKKMSGPKNITINNIPGKELEKNNEEGYGHGYILYKKNILYIALAFSTNNNPKSIQNITEFLASYHPVENTIDQNAMAGMYTFSDPVFAYSIELPSAPRSGDDLGISKDKSIMSQIKICIDQQTGGYFIFGASETQRGYSLTNDSATLEKIRENVKSKYAKIFYDTAYTENHHRILVCEGLMAKANLVAKTFYKMRGNRWYSIVAMYAPGKSNPTIDKVIGSLRFLNYQRAAWQNKNAPDLIFNTWSPSNFIYLSEKDTSDAKGLQHYETYDSTHGNSYVIVREGLGKYFWKQNDSIFWDSFIQNNVSYNYTLVSKKPVHNGSVEGVEFETKEKGSLQIHRKRMLLYGDSLYTLSTTQFEEDIHDADVTRFFEDFTFNNTPPESHALKSKAKILLDDLLSTDSITRESAAQKLYDAPFDRSEIPLLQQAILQDYKQPGDDQNINESIAKRLIALHDTSSLHFATEHYLQTVNSKIKIALLNIISSFQTNENFITMTKLLRSSPPSEKPSYIFMKHLKDSISLTTATLYPSILSLLADTVMISPILNISEYLLDSNMISIDLFRKYEPSILRFAGKRYLIMKADSDKYEYSDILTAQILQKFNSRAANDMLQKYLSLHVNELRMEGVRLLISNKQPVSETVLEKLAKNKNYRVELYNNLAKYNKQILFPKAYLSQQQFAESLVYTFFSEDDNEIPPDAIIPVLQKTAMYKGHKAKFYFFKLIFKQDDGKHYQLGCAGPFSINSQVMSVNKAFGAVYGKDDYDAANLKEDSNALIKQMEGGDSEHNE